MIDADCYLMRLLTTTKLKRAPGEETEIVPVIPTETERKRYAQGFLAALLYASEIAVETGHCECDGAPDGTGPCRFHDAVHKVQHRLCVSGVYKQEVL
jgi:hypothetical protein